MSSIWTDTISTGLEATFTRIQRERMVDMPMVNPALRVQAVAFQAWNNCCLGVLITPWFMNLMLLPGEDDDWSELGTGSKQLHVFPSGRYEFIVAEESAVGWYQMCSLLSPVFEFQDQETAVITAETVMNALMDGANREGLSTRDQEMAKIWRGAAISQPTAETSSADQDPPPIPEPSQQPSISRRELLRSALSRGEN